VNDPNSFRNPEFLKDLEFINDQLSSADLHRQRQLENLSGNDFSDLDGSGEAAISGFNRQLEEACFATGATGAAIALVREEKIVCYATAGSHVPDIGVCLDPRNGLSGCCFQTRQLQHCNDTEKDSRVDPEASRGLGVRSIVVLPLMDGEELFGIVEILSVRPNAFSESDLDTLRALSQRIVENRGKTALAAPTVAPQESVSFTTKLEAGALPIESHSPNSTLPRRKRKSPRSDLRGAALGTLVIAAAMLLGMLVGWRLGWQKATLGFQAGSTPYRTNTQDKRTDHTMYPGNSGKDPSKDNERQQTLAGVAECAPPKTVVPPAPAESSGLTISHEGRVIFRLSPSATSTAQDLPSGSNPPAEQADPVPQ
jgi:GAF domain